MVYTKKKSKKITRRKRSIKSMKLKSMKPKRITKRRTNRINHIYRTIYRKKKRNLKTGGSVIYSVEDNETQDSDETTSDGHSFFRKVYPKNNYITIGRETYPIGKESEKEIIKILMSHKQHPNIVKFYAIHDNAIDMEELETYTTDEDYQDKNFTPHNMKQQFTQMIKVKDFLQSLGIMYMDWKFDNIGKAKDKDKDKNVYKLFDFDSSGLINLKTNEWLIEPLHIKGYDLRAIREYKRRIGTGDKPMTAKEMDDWSFEYNITDQL
jgi:serine/threonine protein kinase